MQLQDEQLTGCRDFYRRWFGLEVVFEASWFVLLGAGAGGRASLAFMHPSHPSAPPGPELARRGNTGTEGDGTGRAQDQERHAQPEPLPGSGMRP
jgi:catechol 2,3-dioxygenase-like lactoylglutathione lyase family enzyme